MENKDIINKLKKEKLKGRSGSGFPTGLKWETVKKARAKKKYIVCNASEGELGVTKDSFILNKYPEEVIVGIKVALKTIDNSSAFIYLRKDYYEKFKNKLKSLIGSSSITLVKKHGGYIAGEETSVCEGIEGKRPEPRLKPPYPVISGINGCPTLVNNVETFYCVAKIAKGEYKKTRFYTISGDIKNKGVFELPESWTIQRILIETKNLPDFDFFVKAGGGACGEILLPKELNKIVSGIGSIIVYNRQKANFIPLMKEWADFFHKGNCDKCVPCREGVYRIKEMMKKGRVDKKLLDDLFFVLENTSFCGLGKIAPRPFKGTISKLMK